MQQVILKPLHHRNQECIGIYFDNSPKLNGAIRKYAGARWSQTNKCWYVPLSKENYNKLFFALKGKGEIEQSALHQYLADKKNKTQQAIIKPPLVAKLPAQPASKKNSTVSQQPIIKNTKYKGIEIAPVNAHVLPAIRERLILKAFSPSTIKTYTNEMSQLLQTLNNKPADELKPEHLKRYLVYCNEKLKLTENTLHSRINAMKFYYEQVLGREKFFWEIPRPKKPIQLPHFFSQQDIVAIIKTTQNLKHKVMLMLAYSAGLRVSEVVAIKNWQVDEDRMSILI